MKEEEEEKLQRKPVEEEEEELQAKETSGSISEIDPDLESNIQSIKGAGQPLSASERAFFEPRFGADFGKVRVHNDTRAADVAQSVNARAFTLGHDVVFGAGQYSPGTGEGRRLLAHELTHAVQQQGLKSRAENHESRKNIGAAGMTGPMFHNMKDGTLQKAAPAIGIGALAGKCIIGAIIGVLLDLGIQGALHMWKKRTWRFWRMTVDYCSLILSAVLSCIGGIAAAKWLEPWINSALGGRLGGIGGTLLGRILIFIANKLGIGVPKFILKTLLKLNCISKDQAKVIGG